MFIKCFGSISGANLHIKNKYKKFFAMIFLLFLHNNEFIIFFAMNDNTKHSWQEKTETDTLEQKEYDLIVFNDDFNTFDFVIEQLMSICEHSFSQAQQCTFQIHYKGKCSVKKGSYQRLVPMCKALLEKGLTAQVQ